MLTAAAVPAAGIASMTADGGIGPDGIEAAYTIEFEGGGGAEGEITVRPGA
jgi:hypothetical protein